MGFGPVPLGARGRKSGQESEMPSGQQVTLALGVGYILGRGRKRKLAIMAGTTALVGASSGPVGVLVRRGTKMVVSRLGPAGALGKVSPEVGEIAGLVRGDLLNAGKSAASAAVRGRIESLSDSLHDRAETLRNPVEEVTGTVLPTEDGDEDQDSERANRSPASSGRRAADSTSTARTSAARSSTARGTRRATGGTRAAAASGRRTASAPARRGASGGSSARGARADAEKGSAAQRGSSAAGTGSTARARQRPARESGSARPVRRAARPASQGR